MSNVNIINNTIYDGDALLRLVNDIRKIVKTRYFVNSPLVRLKIRYLNKKRMFHSFGPYFAWCRWWNNTRTLELAIVRRGCVGGNALIWLAESVKSDELNLPREVVQDICRVVLRAFSSGWGEDDAIDRRIAASGFKQPTIKMNEKAAGSTEYSLQKAKSGVIKCVASIKKTKVNIKLLKKSLARQEASLSATQAKLIKEKAKVKAAENRLAKAKGVVKKKSEDLKSQFVIVDK